MAATCFSSQQDSFPYIGSSKTKWTCSKCNLPKGLMLWQMHPNLICKLLFILWVQHHPYMFRLRVKNQSETKSEKTIERSFTSRHCYEIITSFNVCLCMSGCSKCRPDHVMKPVETFVQSFDCISLIPFYVRRNLPVLFTGFVLIPNSKQHILYRA